MLTNEDSDDLNFDISDFKDIEEILNDSDSDGNNSDGSEEKTNKYNLITRRIDSNKIRHKTAKALEVYTSSVKNVRMSSDNPIRCGVVVYTHYKGKTYFCLGVDSVYGDLTDFGGGIKKNETVIEGGLRELKEESQAVFGNITVEEIQDSMTFYTNNMMIIFVKRQIKMQQITQTFREKMLQKISEDKTIEVKDITWIEKQDFLDSIFGKGRRIYSRVRKILYKVSHIIAAM